MLNLQFVMSSQASTVTSRPAIAPEFIAEMHSQFGEHIASRLIEALDTQPSVSVRLNPKKTTSVADLFPDAKPVAWAENGFYLPERPQFAKMPEWHAGAFYVQDASSMFIGHVIKYLISDNQPVKLLDLCAAPGGKTTGALDVLPEGSVCVANELMPARAAILKENLLKWGASDTFVTSTNAQKFGKLTEVFDIIIADVPCSGEGMMRKDDEARRQWSEGLVNQCAALQREIADEAVKALKPGGHLIYSTCTFNRREDENNVRYLIDTYGLESIEIPISSDWEILPSLDDDIHAYRFLPGFTEGEGLFLTVLRKPEEASPSGSKPRRDKKQKNTIKPYKPLKINPSDWLKQHSGPFTVYEKEGHLFALSTDGADMLAQLVAAGIGLLSAGVQLSEVKGKDLIPKAPLAWSEALADEAFPAVELTEQQALDYLHRDAVTLSPEAPKGFVIAAYRGLRLGFLKNLGNRANNLFPQEYRLRIK